MYQNKIIKIHLGRNKISIMVVKPWNLKYCILLYKLDLTNTHTTSSFENRLSTAIIVVKLNRTFGGICFKIRKLESLFLSAVDEKLKRFFAFSNRVDDEEETFISQLR